MWRTRGCSGGAQEIDRLVNGNAAASGDARAERDRDACDRAIFAKLHELVAAADMDLARMTYAEPARAARLLLAQRRRHSGADRRSCSHAGALDEPARALANRIGVGIRQTEMLRDLRQDAHDGRALSAAGRAGAATASGIEDLRAARCRRRGSKRHWPHSASAILRRSRIAAH